MKPSFIIFVYSNWITGSEENAISMADLLLETEYISHGSHNSYFLKFDGISLG